MLTTVYHKLFYFYETYKFSLQIIYFQAEVIFSTLSANVTSSEFAQFITFLIKGSELCISNL